MTPDARPGERGLLVDYGGVLTTSVTRSFRACCERMGLPPDLAQETFLAAYGGPGEEGPIHLVETGRITVAEFAEGLAGVLSERAGVPVDPEGLLAGLFAGIELDEAMLTAVAAARTEGVRTALLSNSWGSEGYPRDRFPGLFDAVVISGEVGFRKPDPAIYALAADRLGLRPQACVFIDDVETNVRAAEAAGMHGLLHRRAEETLPALAALLGLDHAVLAG